MPRFVRSVGVTGRPLSWGSRWSPWLVVSEWVGFVVGEEGVAYGQVVVPVGLHVCGVVLSGC